jgi:hypothetical protein
MTCLKLQRHIHNTPTVSPTRSHLSNLSLDHAPFPTAADPALAQLQNHSPRLSARRSVRMKCGVQAMIFFLVCLVYDLVNGGEVFRQDEGVMMALCGSDGRTAPHLCVVSRVRDYGFGPFFRVNDHESGPSCHANDHENDHDDLATDERVVPLSPAFESSFPFPSLLSSLV